MIRELKPSDKELILEYAYRSEKENLFLIGSFRRSKPFEDNKYYGWFDGDSLEGVCVYFGIFRNLVIHSKDRSVIQKFVDQAISENCRIENVTAFRKYAEPTVECLRSHGLEPKHISDETVYILTQDSFVDFSKGNEERAQDSDIDECVMLQRSLRADWAGESDDSSEPITDGDREKIWIDGTFVLHEDGRIVSKANIHGISKNYVQIGGVITRPDYQRRGYAKQVVSKLINHYFDEDIPNAILFARNVNEPAKKVYMAIGFRPIDEFVIAEYTGLMMNGFTTEFEQDVLRVAEEEEGSVEFDNIEDAIAYLRAPPDSD